MATTLLKTSNIMAAISLFLFLQNIVEAEVEASSTTAGDQYDDYYNGNVAYDDEATNQRRSNADFEIYTKVTFANTSTSTLRLQNINRVIQTNMNTIILNGSDVLYLEVAIGSTNITQRSIGRLDNIDEDIVDIEAITWNRHTLFVVALVSRYNVYWAKNDSDNGIMVPIEHIALHGEHQKIVLFGHGGELFGLIGNVVRSGEFSSTIRLYKWRQSHFTLLETQNLNTFSNIMHCTAAGSLIVVVVKNDFTDMETVTDTKQKRLTLVQVHTFENGHLLRRQNMFVYAISTHFAAVQQQCMLFSVTERSAAVGAAETFVWDYDYLKKYQEHQALWIDQLADNGHGLIVVQGQHRLDAYTQPALEKPYPIEVAASKTDSSRIVLMKSNGRQFLLVLLTTNDENQYQLQVNCIEVRLEPVIVSRDDVSAEPFLPDKCYSDLQSAVKNRQSHVNRLASELEGILRKDQKTHFPGTIQTTAKVLAAHGNFSRLTIDTRIDIGAMELLKQIDRLQQRLDEVKSLQRSRPKRDATKNDTEFEIINVKYLNVSTDMFKNVLLKSPEIHFGKEIRAGTLTVHQIRMPNTASTASTTSLRSVASTNVIQATSIPKVRRLIVKTINGIDWDEFYQSTYKMGSNVTIKGDLVLSKAGNIQDAELQLVNSIPIETFFTLHTPQTITANVSISRFFATNVASRLVNDIAFGNDVAKTTDNTTIHGPVKLERCTIDKLTLSDNEDTDFARHIVGTEQEDLSQVYNGKVTIIGSLKLNDIILERPNRTKIFVNEKRFHFNVADLYWMKSIDQHFDTVRFEYAITAPQCHTRRINAQPASNCLLINQSPPYNVSMIMESAAVPHGNVYTDPQYATSASSINEQCIRRTDTAVVSGGCKTFTGHLSIEDFQCKNLDDIDLKQIVQRPSKGKSYDFESVKQFKHITVDGKVKILTDLIEIGYLNGYDLMEFAKNYVRIDKAVRLESLTFAENVRVQSASIGNIGGKVFNDVIQAIEAAVGENGTIRAVRVLGNVVFTDEIYAETVNGIPLDAYLSQMVTKHSEGLEIVGTKQFKTLTVKQLTVSTLNAIDLDYWFENALHMRKPQLIHRPWTIDCVRAEQLDAVAINGVTLNRLVDSSSDRLEITSDITVDSLVMGNSVSGQLSCDLAAIDRAFAESFRNKHWAVVDIVGSVNWPGDDCSTPINQLIRYAVTDMDQEIIGDVTFINPIMVHQAASSKYLLNEIDILALQRDALVKEAEFQHVIAVKHFKNNISIANLITENVLSVPMVNAVDILRLNESMFRKDRDTHVTAVKTFQTTPLIYSLNVRGTINGIETLDLVCSNSPNALPPIVFHGIVYVEKDLAITGLFNGFSLEYFLENRVRLTGPPQELTASMTFKNLVIKGAARLPQINGIAIEDVVVLSSDALQTVTGHKNVYGNVTIDGPAMFGTINGMDVVQTYMNTIFLDQNDVAVAELEVYGNVNVQRGVYVRDRLNNVDINALTHWNPPTPTDLAPINEEVSSALLSARSALQRSDLKLNNLLYLDYAADIRIKYEFNPNIPKTFTVDTAVACQRCLCPAQNDVSITSTLQIYIHRRPVYERLIALNGQHVNVTIRTTFRADECGSSNSTTAGTMIMWRNSNSDPSEKTMMLSEPSIGGAVLFEQDDTRLLIINYYNGSIAVMSLDGERWNFIGVVVAEQHEQRHYHHMEVLSWDNYNILLVFAKPAERHLHGKAEMYYFDGAKFVVLHGDIPGDYDRCAVSHMRTRNEYMIWLTHSGTDVLTIFKAVYHERLLQRFVLLQKIVVNGMVVNIVPMNVDDFRYVVVITQHDHLYVYKYNYLEGWTASTNGYFKGVETVVPFKVSGRDYLFVSMKSASTALVVYQLGDF